MVIADRNSLSIDDKKWFNKIENVVDVPNLLEIQTESFIKKKYIFRNRSSFGRSLYNILCVYNNSINQSYSKNT